jgi:adenine-specific DNA methylase
MPSFIETQFPIARLSAESYKERKAGASQTLTGLGKWWGRKPLILVRASIIGMLMPASNDPKKDREVFLQILTMDDDGLWQRCGGEIPGIEWKNAASLDIQNKFFSPRGFKQDLSEDDKDTLKELIWNSLSDEKKTHLDTKRRRPFDSKYEFNSLSYSDRIEYCTRPENVVGPTPEAWFKINSHLNTSAGSLAELIEELGKRFFGRTPRVGDSFCGGGSIPFEAARIGCQAFGSDLNPVAGLLTWSGINLLGSTPFEQEKLKKIQEQLFFDADKIITSWGIEHNNKGERAESYLYCVEVKPEGSEYYIPLAPSWMVSEKYRWVVKWNKVPGSDRLCSEVVQVSDQELEQYKRKKYATISAGRIHDPFDVNRTWSIESIRGKDGLRRWINDDFEPKIDDVLQERLYCIRWAKEVELTDERGVIVRKIIRRFAAPDKHDLEREDTVRKLLRENFSNWQSEGFIPSKKIESGYNTDQPTRERGWTYWHHLFTPRQLLIYGCYLSGISKGVSKEGVVAAILKLAIQANWNSRLCVWNADKSKGPGSTEQTFANQALNTLYSFGTRSFGQLSESLLKPFSFTQVFSKSNEIKLIDARDLKDKCDIWITDPPYADAVNYHELGDFFLAWYDKQLAKVFPEWVTDSRSELAVRGDGEEFRKSMVEIYKNLALHMSDNGLQMVMFTHQNPAVWADLGMILWAAGLKVTAAWTISTETSAGLKKGNYVQGTVCLILRKRIINEPGFLDEVYPLVEDEVKNQIRSMQALDDEGEANFNDSDYQLAAYAAALKVLTQYGNLDGKDVEHEVFAVREKNKKSDFQIVIERALGIACDTLIPKGLENSWRDLSLVERYYLRALDIESRGERRQGMYEELARGFGVTDIKPLLKSDKANGARMFTPSGLASTQLGTLGDSSNNQPPIRKGRSGGTSHPFASSHLRHLMFAIRETANSDNSPEPGRQYLRDTFGQLYWTKRDGFIGLLEWLSFLGNTDGMEEWANDSEAARILAGRLRNDHA